MIIACPECSGPYELPDDQISPLVQVACPHCEFRIILDFAAANDASLIEEGMKMASGYASAADYRAAGGAAAPAAKAPAPKAAPAAKIAPAAAPPTSPAPVARPAAAPPPAPPAAKAPSGPVRSAPPPAAQAAAPVPQTAPEDSSDSDTGRTILGQPPVSIPPRPPEDRVKTPAPLELTDKLAEPEAAPPADSEPIELVEPAVAKAAPEPETPDEPASAEPRKPPHTPPTKAASAAPPPSEDPEPEEMPSPAELSAAGLASPDVPEAPRSHAVMYFLGGVLLIIGVLAGFSYYDTGDPNPLPLIEELIRSYKN